ncbi:MAG: hypothetical protein ACRENG_04375, partial [bacterium]
MTCMLNNKKGLLKKEFFKMANIVKDAFLSELIRRFGVLRKIGSSQSVFEVAGGAIRLYIRYSR